jgi:hypothetical protein
MVAYAFVVNDLGDHGNFASEGAAVDEDNYSFN